MNKHKLTFSAFLLFSLVAAQSGNAFASPAPDPTDPHAISLLNSVQAKLNALKNVSTDVTRIVLAPPMSGSGAAQESRTYLTIRLMRPNYGRTDSWQQTTSKDGIWTNKPQETYTADSDGARTWNWSSQRNQYEESAAQPNGHNIDSGTDALGSFFDPNSSLVTQVNKEKGDGTFQSLRYLGKSPWMGSSYSVVELTAAPHLNLPPSLTSKIKDGKVILKTDYYIGSDFLIHREVENYNFGYVIESQLNHLVGDAPLKQVAFKFDIPEGAKLIPPSPPLIGRGESMPNFTVQDAAGKPVRLSDYSGKVVVVDFWATWCGPCQKSLPHTNVVAADFSNSNVVVLGINTWDTQTKFREWLLTHKSYSAIDFLIDPSDPSANIASSQLGVSGIPTQFVVDAAGNIANTFVGYGGPNDDLSNAIKAAIAAVPAGPRAYAGPELFTALPTGNVTLDGKYAAAATKTPQQQIRPADYTPDTAPTTTVTWTKAAGPGNVTFGSPNSLQTTAEFDVPGDYTLNLDVTADGVLSSSTTRVLVAPSSAVSIKPASAVEVNNDTDRSGLVFKYARVNDDTKNKSYSNAYYKFPLSGVGSVSKATLIVYGGVPYDSQNRHPVTVGVHELASTGWDEYSIWQVHPIYSDEIGKFTSVPILANSTQRYYSIDVTKYVADQLGAGSKAVSFALASKSPQINEPFYASDITSDKEDQGTRLIIKP